MAGAFPNVPGPRMAYDKDGTSVFTFNSTANSITEVSALNITKINSEDDSVAFSINSSPGASYFFIGFIFPENRKIDGLFLCGNNPSGSDNFMSAKLQYSTNTTNLLDGTWNDAISNFPFSTIPKTAYRSSIQSLNISSAKAIRLIDETGSANTGQIKNIHIYGSIIEDFSRLAFWHPTQDIPLPGSWLDFGNVGRGTNSTKTFRLKNLSDAETANSIVLSVEAPTDTVPSNDQQHGLAYTGYGYGSSTFIASLAPQAISDIISLKRSTTSDAALSTWTVRILAEVTGGWS